MSGLDQLVDLETVHREEICVGEEAIEAVVGWDKIFVFICTLDNIPMVTYVEAICDPVKQ
jgi:hypothetical protein